MFLCKISWRFSFELMSFEYNKSSHRWRIFGPTIFDKQERWMELMFVYSNLLRKFHRNKHSKMFRDFQTHNIRRNIFADKMLKRKSGQNYWWCSINRFVLNSYLEIVWITNNFKSVFRIIYDAFLNDWCQIL